MLEWVVVFDVFLTLFRWVGGTALSARLRVAGKLIFGPHSGPYLLPARRERGACKHIPYKTCVNWCKTLVSEEMSRR